MIHTIFTPRELLAQLVQSAALTGQRSLVRIQYSSQRKSRASFDVRLFNGTKPSVLELWGIKKDEEQRELFTACLWVQEPSFLVLLPQGKKSSELWGIKKDEEQRELLTPKAEACLHGITRGLVLELAGAHGM